MPPRPLRRAEVAHVDAQGPPHVQRRYERLMHVPEVGPAGLHVLDVPQQVLAPPLVLAGDRVEAQVGDGRWDMRAEHVDLAQALDRRRHLLLGDLAGDVHRRRQRSSYEAEALALQRDHFPVAEMYAWGLFGELLG